jgi:5-methyltetrahydrofolate--homocysteine methyltransferase
MSESAEERFKTGAWLVENLTKIGFAPDDIFIDPLVRPVSTGTHFALVVYETVRRIRAAFPGVHTVCGLSNVSYGLPARKLINQTFLVHAMQAGLDAAIVDPLDKRLMSLIYASELLLGRDEYAANFLSAFRGEKLEF